VLAAIWLAAALPATVCAQEPRSAPPAQTSELLTILTKLTTEIRELRGELVQQRLSRQEEAIFTLERQLAAVRGERERLDEEDRSSGQELQQVNERLNQPSLNNDERMQLESVRAGLTASPQQFGAQRSFIAQREAHLLERLAQEKNRHAESTAIARELKQGPARAR
jgi:hypothetical protein